MNQTWHYLDALSIWGKEFASALGTMKRVVGWIPQLSWTGAFEKWERPCRFVDPPLETKLFPIQRGYRRGPIGWMSRTPQKLHGRMKPGGVLVLTSPYYARLAELWDGPVIYYVTDLLPKYGGFQESQVRRLDRRMCRTAAVVCPNSKRIAEYLTSTADCPSAKITILPNATRRQNLLPEPPYGPGPLPAALADLPQPIAGVIGNMANNVDWELLEQVVQATPYLSWALVGPTPEFAGEASQRAARARLMEKGGRVRFTGGKPYGELRDYARAFDVAVLPYRKKEPTYSGSSTRYYEHLAACRPMVATHGFAELQEKRPLLRLAADASQMIAHLSELDAAGFRDGYEALRWKTSLSETWEARASRMIEALSKNLSGYGPFEQRIEPNVESPHLRAPAEHPQLNRCRPGSPARYGESRS